MDAVLPRAWVAWRLLGNNHREVARSATVFPDVTSCVASIRRLRRALEHAAAETSIETVDRLWGWVVRVDSAPVAVASRLYLRQRECEYSCQVFVGTAASAELPATAPAPRPAMPIDAKVATE